MFPALLLAVVSSAAAFISNGVAGIQAIVQFGIGTAIALLIGFAILGIAAPRWLLTIEDMVGDPPLDRGLMIRYKLGFITMALFAGVVVAMTVGAPIIGAIALLVFVPLFIYLPIRMTRKSYAKAAAAGRPTGMVIKGAGHGFKAAGDVVHFLARWRVMTIPVTVALALMGAVAFTQVDSEFSFEDFFSEDSTFGTLTAVMIVFSLLVALMVLPSVLLVVTRSRTGADRQHILDLTGVSAEDYEPHARETALAGHDSVRR